MTQKLKISLAMQLQKHIWILRISKCLMSKCMLSLTDKFVAGIALYTNCRVLLGWEDNQGKGNNINFGEHTIWLVFNFTLCVVSLYCVCLSMQTLTPDTEVIAKALRKSDAGLIEVCH